MENDSDSIILFGGVGKAIHAHFTHSELVLHHRLLSPCEIIPQWRWVVFDGQWHYPIYRNYGIPNG